MEHVHRLVGTAQHFAAVIGEREMMDAGCRFAAGCRIPPPPGLLGAGGYRIPAPPGLGSGRTVRRRELRRAHLRRLGACVFSERDEINADLTTLFLMLSAGVVGDSSCTSGTAATADPTGKFSLRGSLRAGTPAEPPAAELRSNISIGAVVEGDSSCTSGIVVHYRGSSLAERPTAVPTEVIATGRVATHGENLLDTVYEVAVDLGAFALWIPYAELLVACRCKGILNADAWSYLQAWGDMGVLDLRPHFFSFSDQIPAVACEEDMGYSRSMNLVLELHS